MSDPVPDPHSPSPNSSYPNSPNPCNGNCSSKSISTLLSKLKDKNAECQLLEQKLKDKDKAYDELREKYDCLKDLNNDLSKKNNLLQELHKIDSKKNSKSSNTVGPPLSTDRNWRGNSVSESDVTHSDFTDVSTEPLSPRASSRRRERSSSSRSTSSRHTPPPPPRTTLIPPPPRISPVSNSSSIPSSSQNGTKRPYTESDNSRSVKLVPPTKRQRALKIKVPLDRDEILSTSLTKYFSAPELFKCRLVSKKWNNAVLRELGRRAPVITSDWNDKKSASFDWNKYRFPYYVFFFSQSCIEKFLEVFKNSSELPFQALKIYGAPHNLYDKFTTQFGHNIRTIYLNDRSMVNKYNMCRIQGVFPNLRTIWYNDRNETLFKYSTFELRGIEKLVMNVNRNNKLEFVQGAFRKKINVEDLRELRFENFGLGDHGLNLLNNCRNLKVLETTICLITEEESLMKSVLYLRKLILCIDGSKMASSAGVINYKSLNSNALAFLKTQTKTLRELELEFKVSTGTSEVDLGDFTLPPLNELRKLRIDTTKSNRVRKIASFTPITRKLLPQLEKLSLYITVNEIPDINEFQFESLSELELHLSKCTADGVPTPAIKWAKVAPKGINTLSLETDSLSIIQSVFNRSFTTSVHDLKLVIHGLPKFDDAQYSASIAKLLSGFTADELFDTTNMFDVSCNMSFDQFVDSKRKRPCILLLSELRSVYIEWKANYKLKLDYDSICQSLNRMGPLALLTLRNFQISEGSQKVLQTTHKSVIID